MAKSNFGASSGIADPKPISGMPEPDEDDIGPQPGGGATLDDDTVKYHADPQSCQNCSHFQDGNCEVLGHDVDPGGGCIVWSGGSSDMDSMGGDGASPMPGGPMPGGPGGGGPSMYGS